MNISQKEEMSEEILLALGFVMKKDPIMGELCWTHSRGKSFYYHILTPEMVTEALIDIGIEDFRENAIEYFSSVLQSED